MPQQLPTYRTFRNSAGVDLATRIGQFIESHAEVEHMGNLQTTVRMLEDMELIHRSEADALVDKMIKSLVGGNE
jgi:hypothetical protein